MRSWLLIAALAAGACSRASNESNKKQWQEQPPPNQVTIPAGLSITVTVQGADHAPITSELLEKTQPDFVDPEHKAWRIPTLIPEATPGTTIEAASRSGVAVKFAEPTPEGLEAVLFLTRRGEVIVAALDPKEPFPRYHGQGARLKRPGDTMPRVGPVIRLSITKE